MKNIRGALPVHSPHTHPCAGDNVQGRPSFCKGPLANGVGCEGVASMALLIAKMAAKSSHIVAKKSQKYL